jgi:hypothetical protein
LMFPSSLELHFVVLVEYNLVDPASSHMLVSRIKPCKSKYEFHKWRNCERLIITVVTYTVVILKRIPLEILVVIRASQTRL